MNYPVSAWKFGNDLAMVFSGEVVADYSVRLGASSTGRALAQPRANDMPGYILTAHPPRGRLRGRLFAGLLRTARAVRFRGRGQAGEHHPGTGRQ